MTTVTPETIEKLKQLMEAATANPSKDITGANFVLMNRKGETLFNHSAGKQGLDPEHNYPLQKDAVFWIASCTKIATATLALIAVEEGRISLDDPKQVEAACPELKSIPILQDVDENGKITLVPKKNPITLRMLLTHTAGFSYTHLNKNLLAYGRIFGIHEGTGHETSLLQPILFEPGTSWGYGIGLDWAMVVLSRTYKKSTDYLINEKLFKPLGIIDTSYIPNDDLKKRTVTLSFRKPHGGLIASRRLQHRAQSEDRDYALGGVQYGGAGLYAVPAQYIKLLATLLNDGVSPHTGNRILSKETVDLVFTNQIPQWPNFGREASMLSHAPSLANDIPQVYTQKGDPPQGWGISFFINLTPTDTGRAEGSGFWCGICNTYYWVDRKSGIAGFLATNTLPASDPKVNALLDSIERTIYKGLDKEQQQAKL